MSVGRATPAAPHFILYGLPDGTAHRVTGNLTQGIPIPAGARLLELGANELPTATIGYAKA